MRYQRTTFLAGIAALALIAATGFASAQEPGKDQDAAQGKQPHATQQMNKAPATGKMGQSGKMEQNAQEQNRTDGKMGQNAHEQNRKTGPNTQKLGQQTDKNRSNKSAKADFGKKHEVQRHGEQNTAQRRNGFEGLQGNASGMNVQLNDQQRTQIRETVINAQGAPRIGNVDFNVAVGTVIPRGNVQVVPVPETLVRIDPRWRGHRYFVWNDAVVIVDPRDMRIVAVLYV